MTNILLTPVEGTDSTTIIVTNDTIYVNDVATMISDVTDAGPIRTEADRILVEYAEGGQVSAQQVGAAHNLLWSTGPTAPPTPPVTEPPPPKHELPHPKVLADEEDDDDHPKKGKKASKK